jgi:hypothetical protein
MGISTVSGPFRSQNGFQELVNGVWTPVGGGSGGIAATVTLGDADGEFYGISTDNRYSDSYNSLSGTTAGTYIQLPAVEIGQSILVDAKSFGFNTNVWALKYPENVPGVDVWTVWGSALATPDATPSSEARAVMYPNLQGSNPSPFWYIYSSKPESFILTRIPGYSIPGFGTVALFAVQNTLFRVARNEPTPGQIVFADPTQFPAVYS